MTLYIVYGGESGDDLFEGECTNTVNVGILARQTGPDGPVSMKCLSASPNPKRFNLLRSSSTVSNCEAVVSSFGCVEPDDATSSNPSGMGFLFRIKASAPLVTKFENRLSDLPPRRL